MLPSLDLFSLWMFKFTEAFLTTWCELLFVIFYSKFKLNVKLFGCDTITHNIEFIYVFFLYYRPQRSWGKVIFSEACVKNSVHRGGGRSPGPHPGGRLRGLAGVGLQAHNPGGVSQHALRQTTPPPADGYCCGRYASYWNAFLLKYGLHGWLCFQQNNLIVWTPVFTRVLSFIIKILDLLYYYCSKIKKRIVVEIRSCTLKQTYIIYLW